MSGQKDLAYLANERRDFLCVVRLMSSAYWSHGSLIVERKLRVLKRLSEAPDFLHQEVIDVGAAETAATIVNLFNCADGLYDLVMTEISRDYETGYLDCYKLKLVPSVQRGG